MSTKGKQFGGAQTGRVKPGAAAKRKAVKDLLEEQERRGVVTYSLPKGKSRVEVKPIPSDWTGRKFIFNQIGLHTKSVVVEARVGGRWKPMLRYFFGTGIQEVA